MPKGPHVQSFLFSLFKDTLPFALVIIGACALIVGCLAYMIVDPALAKPGPDRDQVVASLRAGGTFRHHYVFLTSYCLDWIDRRLGDAGDPAPFWKSPFGNRESKPYWTGASLDTCALLAILYPFLAMFLTWLATGDAGELGDALRLTRNAPPQVRTVALASGVWMAGGLYCFHRSGGRRRWLWLVLTLGGPILFRFLLPGAGAAVLALAFGVPVGMAVAVAGAGAGAIAGTFAIVCAVAVAVPFVVPFAVVVALASASAFALAVAVLAAVAKDRNRLGLFWLAFGPLATAASYLLLHLGVRLDATEDGLMLIVMIGLLPLLNVLWDWLSIGFTRALLRRGCEDGAWHPFWLGLIDLAIGLGLLFPLAATLVFGLQTVDWIMRAAHHPLLINVPARLLALRDTPLDPANWWVYATLFSTLIPSALNCVIGMISLTTIFSPRLRNWLIDGIENVEQKGRRVELHLILAAQPVVGTILAGLAIWVAGSLILLAGPAVLDFFLWVAEALEWRLTS